MRSVTTLLLLLLTFTFLSCAHRNPKFGDEKKSECGEVPVGVTIDKGQLDMAGATIGNFSLANLNIQFTPEFQRIISDAATNALVQDYISCKVIERAGVQKDPELVDYFTNLTYFLSSKPTGEEQTKWRQANPFPRKKGNRVSQSPSTSQHSEGANSPNVAGDQNVVIINPPASEAKLDEIRDLLRQRGYPDDPNKLFQKYPLGYAIFELTYMSQFTPYEGLSVLKNYEKVDWSEAKVIQNTKDRVALRLPDLKRKDGTGGITGVTTGGPKKVGLLACGTYRTQTEGIGVCGEILGIREDGIVFLVNLMQLPPLSKQVR